METSLIKQIKASFSLPDVDIRTYSPLTLAYIGDAVYEIIVRTILVGGGNQSVNQLNKKASALVNASAQKDMYHAVAGLLTEEETDIYKRGRNAKSYSMAKNASLTDYKTATGMEALAGYLYLTDRLDRIFELFQYGFKITGKEAENR